MSVKNIPRPDRIRRVPSGFGWVDHRFVRHGHISRLSREALALYLFLVTVADENGISWYSDSKVSQLLGMTEEDLADARQMLSASSLVSYCRPVYQVMELPSADRLSAEAAQSTEALPALDRRIGRTCTAGELLAMLSSGECK